MPEFLDAGFLPRGRSTAGSLPAQTSPPGPATPTGFPPAQTVSPSPSSRPSQATPPGQITRPGQGTPPGQITPPSPSSRPSQITPPRQGTPPSQVTPPNEATPSGPVPSRNRPGAGFAAGDVLDVTLPGPTLAGAADTAAGPDRGYAGISDEELIGVLTAWQRTESWAAAGGLSATAELARRRPATSKDHATRGGNPAPWGKFCADEVAAALSVSRRAAEKTTAVAHDLATRLPLTRQALHEGCIDAYKAQVIAEATRCLDDAAAAQAEAAVVPHAVTGKTPGQIRAAIARAVLKADPTAAKQRREQAQKDARVELWREDAGTAAIVSFGLPPDEALAADQQITSYAMDLKAAGVPGTMDALRVRAYLDALLGQDTAARYQTTASQPSNDSPSNDSPAQDNPSNDSPSNDSPSDDGPSNDGPPARDGDGPHSESGAPDGNRTPGDRAAPEQPSGTGPDGPPPAPIRPAAKINLTITLATLLGLAEHPGEATGFGPIDATLARTLAAQAAGHPATTWCITVTDPDGHPLAHGCAKPGGRKPEPPRTRPPAPGSRPTRQPAQ